MSNIVITSFAVSCRASSLNRFGELDQLCMRSDRRRETRRNQNRKWKNMQQSCRTNVPSPAGLLLHPKCKMLIGWPLKISIPRRYHLVLV